MQAVMDAGGEGCSAGAGRAAHAGPSRAQITSRSYKYSSRRLHPFTGQPRPGLCLHVAALNIWIPRGSEELANPVFASNIFVYPASPCKERG